MGVEYELKFRASPAVLERICRDVDAPQEQIAMQTTYYDTPAQALTQRHCTLRCRRENGKPVCTLKTPGQAIGRQEWEVAEASLENALPVLCKLSGMPELEELLQAGIVPVCGARFTRIAKKVVYNQAVLELALDSGVLLGGGKELPFWEVEVELKEGSPQAAQAYSDSLSARYGLEAEHASKFRRAFALTEGEKNG